MRDWFVLLAAVSALVATVSTKEGQYLSIQYGESSVSYDTPEVVLREGRTAAS